MREHSALTPVARAPHIDEPERQLFDQPASMRPFIEAAHRADTIVDGRPRIGPPRVRTWSLQHAVAIRGDRHLVGGPPVDTRLLQRVEPVVEMLGVSAHRLGRMRATKNRGMFDQVRKGGLDDRHVIIEQNRKAVRNTRHASGRPHDHRHDAVLVRFFIGAPSAQVLCEEGRGYSPLALLPLAAWQECMPKACTPLTA